MESAALAYQMRDPLLSKTAHTLQPSRRIEEEPHKTNNLKQIPSKLLITIATSGSSGLITSSIVVIVMLSVFKKYLLEQPHNFSLVTNTVLLVVIARALALSLIDATNIRNQISFYNSEKKRETWEYDNYREGEQREMVELYTNKGMSERDAEKVVSLMSNYRELFIDIMMAEELQLMPVDAQISPLMNGLTTFATHIVFGMVPSLPLYLNQSYIFAYYSIFPITVIAVFLLGLLQSYQVTNRWWSTAFIHALYGALAIFIAASLGTYFQQP